MLRLSLLRSISLVVVALFGLETAQAQTVVRVGTTVTVTGTAAADTAVAAFVAPNQVTITLNGVPTTFLRSQVRLLVVNLLDGADSFVGTTVPFNCEVNGGPGDDSLTGGKSGDELNGDGGNDTIYGNAGIDSCDGGAGNDFIDAGQNNDGIDGGTGRDILVGGGGLDSINGGVGEDILVSGFMSASSVAALKATWFNSAVSFNDRLAAISLAPPIVSQDPLEDIVAGGTGRDLFLTNIVPPVEPGEPALDLLIDFVDGSDADFSDLLPPVN